MGGRIRFDVVVSLVILATLMAVLLERLLYYEEYAEKTVVDMTVTQMKVGLQWRKAEIMLGTALGQPMAGLPDNPIEWLPFRPAEYRGEFAGDAPATEGDGIWYFDTVQRDLVYRPRLSRHFDAAPAASAQVRVRAVRNLAPKDAAPPLPSWEGVSLVRVGQDQWFRGDGL
ncbi:MAG: hypothetical protein KIT73_19745 [Burkholderiales bacterium]|nr:hypothetical protein [Burkholderiales bacterium]